ncbi:MULTISPECIES: efflux RND transporter periplasmic adaptor subunit [Thermus]|uniref:Efflux RND transporter periplasmic adaptor subunit n=1 Tax=Thermus brevis TaxID=2862456 RepID=A0ABS6ZXI4_9DEIN|nr:MULTISPECIES: efflux RND transporter periplasmic adaptor subunit [Thermus]MBW6394530.1 efflux RND transporter periplasmic adaptor subunit [Thermus brevis]QWK22901.1 MAG: efflux RND transporter periplasmic adaptor subunit [Thermus antranikianii]
MRRWSLLVLVLLLGVGGYLLLRPKGTPRAQEVPEVYTVARGEVRVVVAGSGQLQPWRTLEVRPEVQGILLSVVEEGKAVKAGEVLAELDPDPFRRAWESARADLQRAEASLANARAQGESSLASLQAGVKNAEVAYANAQASLETARRNLEATRLLYQAGGTSRQALWDAETAYANAQRALENARASLEAQREALRLRQAQLQEDLRAQEAALSQARLALAEAQANLEKTRVRAPFAGVVLSVSANPGAQVGPGTPLLTLGNLSAYALVLEVDETEIAKVRVGQRVDVTLEGLPGETFQGRVEAISPQGQVVNNIPVFKVTVRLPYDPRLRPGMSADGEIVVEEARNLLVIPKRAVERVRGRAYVNVLLPDGSTDTVRVVLGPEDARMVAVLEGLKEGDQVVLPKAGGASQTPRTPSSPSPVPLPGFGR